MKTYIKITSNGQRELLQFEDPEQEYQLLSNAVGGMIEMVPSRFQEHFLYLNEEGKIYGLPFNGLATELSSGLSPWDMIVGDVVLVGPLDDEGNHDSVTDAVIKEVVG